MAAVNEFLESGKMIHAMRDSPGHGVPFVGAAWGANLGVQGARTKWWQAWVLMFKDKKHMGAPRGSWGPDQGLLKLHVWKVFLGQVYQHDAYSCTRAKFKGSRPWPTQRLMEPNNFVASVVTENVTLTAKCPAPCRPKEHPDWDYLLTSQGLVPPSGGKTMDG